MPARILEVTEREYHQDPCAVPSLSQSTARTLLEDSPLEAWLRHPRLGRGAPEEEPGDGAELEPGPEEEPGDAKEQAARDAGTLLHALVLGVEDGIRVVDGFGDWRKKDAKAAKAAAKAAGLLPVLRHKYDAAAATAKRVRERAAAIGCALKGRSEVAIEWTEDDVVCRGKLDHLIIGENYATIIDLKRTAKLPAQPDARARKIGSALWATGGDIQWAAYTRAVEQLRPDLVGRVEFIFLLVEVLPKGHVKVQDAVPSGLMKDMGLTRWRRAVELWRECRASGEWSDGNHGQLHVDPPMWAVAVEEAA